MPENKEPVRNVSEGRKAAYFAGIVIIIAGLILFASNFFTGTINMGVALGGMALIAIGGVVMNTARYGKAGAGLILDPEQERRDKEPLNRSLGGQLGDMLDEAGIGGLGGKKEVIKVRCRNCQALNDETDKFCGQCGQSL